MTRRTAADLKRLHKLADRLREAAAKGEGLAIACNHDRQPIPGFELRPIDGRAGCWWISPEQVRELLPLLAQGIEQTRGAQ